MTKCAKRQHRCCCSAFNGRSRSSVANDSDKAKLLLLYTRYQARCRRWRSAQPDRLLSHYHDRWLAAGLCLLYCVWRNSNIRRCRALLPATNICMYVFLLVLDLVDALSPCCYTAELVSEVRQLRLDVGAAVRFSVQTFLHCYTYISACNIICNFPGLKWFKYISVIFKDTFRNLRLELRR